MPKRRIEGMKVELHEFFDLGTKCRLMVSYTPWLLYLKGKRPRYPRAGLDTVSKRKITSPRHE